MCVSTVSGAGQPSARFVLLRQILPEGLVFFTNYKSRKGRDIDHDPRVAATFWWGELERQIRVEGLIARTSEELSDAYFHSRPRDSQLASAASPQSREVDSREELEEALRDMERRFPEEVERPDHWGGYIITPHAVEFWQGRRARMHDRIQYRLEGTTWTKVRLAP